MNGHDRVLERNVEQVGLDFLAIAIAEELRTAFGEGLDVETHEKTLQGEVYAGRILGFHGPLDPSIRFKLSIENKTRNGVHPVTLEMGVRYTLTKKEGNGDYHGTLGPALDHLEHLFYIAGIPRRRESPDHRDGLSSCEYGITATKRFYTPNELGAVSAFVAIPDAVRYVGKGESWRKITQSYIAAMREITEKDQGVSASASVPVVSPPASLSVSQP